jgi:Fe2+ or Zn2+ uptake regulation protein
MIVKLKIPQEARYDGNISKHCHLICNVCGHIIDIFDLKELPIKSKQLKKKEFMPDLNYLEIHGTCKKCLKKIKYNS